MSLKGSNAGIFIIIKAEVSKVGMKVHECILYVYDVYFKFGMLLFFFSY